MNRPLVSFSRQGLASAGVGALALGGIIWSTAAGATEGQSVADLVERVSPAVVTVFTTEEPQQMSMDGPRFAFPEGSPFEEFFKQFNFPNGMPSPGNAQPAHALGSGFVLDSDGYIITNNHVVEHASEVKVRLQDEREFAAKVIGADAQSDVALLKIDASGALPHVTLGDSDKIRVGDAVIAVGNPFGLGGTVTSGIVSAIGRDINAGPYVDFIQTDAAINHGNSGGPLFDMSGNVIGVNSAIYSPNGGSVGVGFAIPANIVSNVVAQLKDSGSVSRGWLGVAIQNVTPDIASALGLGDTDGALVANVISDGPSRDALKSGDVIRTFDGKPVHDSRDLPRLVGATKAGSRVDVVIMRDGAERTESVKIGKLPNSQQAANDNNPQSEDGAASARLGATVAPLMPDTRRALGLDKTVEGAVVTSLKAGGAASEAGIEVGDVIVQVGGKTVDSPEALDETLSSTNAKSALLLINRHGQQLFVGVKLTA